MSEFSERRRRVLEALGSAVLILPSAPAAIRNNDVEHEYRQDSDFYYLAGFDEPDSVLVLSGASEKPFTLFVRARDPEREVWDGARAGVEGAVSTFGADHAHPIAELAQKLPELLQNKSRLYYRIGFDPRFRWPCAVGHRPRAQAKLGVYWPVELVDPATIIHEMRQPSVARRARSDATPMAKMPATPTSPRSARPRPASTNTRSRPSCAPCSASMAPSARRMGHRRLGRKHHRAPLPRRSLHAGKATCS
ncbi:MAG: aminopeptidase P N-terminal domain-containing protein [Polyangiaceae bacterium]